MMQKFPFSSIQHRWYRFLLSLATWCSVSCTNICLWKHEAYWLLSQLSSSSL